MTKENEIQKERRVLTSTSGKQYDVSFRPAILNRKYYQDWTSVQTRILNSLDKYFKIQAKGTAVTDEDKKDLSDLQALSFEGAKVGMALIKKAFEVNGIPDSEDEILENFSEADLSLAINYIMGVEDKKKQTSN